MLWRVTFCLWLAGCNAYTGLPFSEGAMTATPQLLPTSDLRMRAVSGAEARGVALTEQAAALKVRAAQIGTD